VPAQRASSVTSTTTINSTMPYDPKVWVDKHLGSHVVLSELSTCAPPDFAPAFSSSTFPDMLRALSPMLAAPVDHRSSISRRTRRSSYKIVSPLPPPPQARFSPVTRPRCFGRPSRATTLHIISRTSLDCKILLFLSPRPPPFPRIQPPNLFRPRRKGCCGPRKSDKVKQLLRCT